MKKFYLILVCAFSVTLGFFLGSYLDSKKALDFILQNGKWLFILSAVLTAIVFLIALSAYLLLKRWLKKRLGVDPDQPEGEIVNTLIEVLTNPQNVPNPSFERRRNSAVASLGMWLLRREKTQFFFNVIVTIVGGFVGVATLVLLSEQNNRIALQTDANIIESLQLEGARRAALYLEFSDVTNAVLTELRSDDGKSCQLSASVAKDVGCWVAVGSRDQRVWRLGATTSSSVASFVQRKTPYWQAEVITRRIDFERPLRSQFELVNLSPERGRLAEFLARNEVSLSGIDLSFSKLDGAVLSGLSLSGASIFDASLREAFLIDAGFESATLSRANLLGSVAFEADFTGANLEGANLEQTHFRGAYFVRARIAGARLVQADFSAVNLAKATATSTDFSSATLVDANFQEAQLDGADFQHADLSGADFSGANLSKAIFTDAVDMHDAMFSGAWFWKDHPPVGLPSEIPLTECSSGALRRRFEGAKPQDC